MNVICVVAKTQWRSQNHMDMKAFVDWFAEAFLTGNMGGGPVQSGEALKVVCTTWNVSCVPSGIICLTFTTHVDLLMYNSLLRYADWKRHAGTRS